MIDLDDETPYSAHNCQYQLEGYGRNPKPQSPCAARETDCAPLWKERLLGLLLTCVLHTEDSDLDVFHSRQSDDMPLLASRVVSTCRAASTKLKWASGCSGWFIATVIHAWMHSAPTSQVSAETANQQLGRMGTETPTRVHLWMQWQ